MTASPPTLMLPPNTEKASPLGDHQAHENGNMEKSRLNTYCGCAVASARLARLHLGSRMKGLPGVVVIYLLNLGPMRDHATLGNLLDLIV